MLLSTATYLLLPAAVLAAPAPVTDISPRGLAIREAEGVGLANTNARVDCFIVNSGGPVNCRKGPGLSYPVHTTFDEGTAHTFSCYDTGSCIEENCSWDYAINWGCYVNGFYTDDTCTTENLGHC